MYCITTTYLLEMSEHAAEQCRSLCHEDSEMQQLFGRVADGTVHPHEERWIISTAFSCGGRSMGIIGWASATDWFVANGKRLQVQMFVAAPHRGNGIGTALGACLGEFVTKHTEPVCVFSDHAMAIARRLGWRADQFKSTDDGWIGVGTTDGRSVGTGPDDAGLHDAAPQVCGVPLACGEDGQAT